MCRRIWDGASVGKWANSPLVVGKAVKSGSKWLWTSQDAAQSWQTFVRANCEEGLITTVTTARPRHARHIRDLRIRCKAQRFTS